VSRRQAGPHHELYDKVAVAYTPQAVLREGLKSELFREKVTINGKGVARKSPGAEGQNGYSRDELTEAFEIRTEGEGMGQEEVGPTNGLAALERR
jgi:hypothetical protein